MEFHRTCKLTHVALCAEPTTMQAFPTAAHPSTAVEGQRKRAGYCREPPSRPSRRYGFWLEGLESEALASSGRRSAA